jgi:hypothetical protein
MDQGTSVVADRPNLQSHRIHLLDYFPHRFCLQEQKATEAK